MPMLPFKEKEEIGYVNEILESLNKKESASNFSDFANTSLIDE